MAWNESKTEHQLRIQLAETACIAFCNLPLHVQERYVAQSGWKPQEELDRIERENREWRIEQFKKRLRNTDWPRFGITCW